MPTEKDTTAGAVDYYEFLQISPNADADTIHRVYRFLAARLHPDNPASGDAEMFHLLKTAYDVLSNPVRRADYDAATKREAVHRDPLSASVDFMDKMDGELNRRLAVLAVLYYRRRTSPHAPEVSLTELELRMGFPRDYLDFTTWYLVKKNFITRADNSAFTLTADGVDFVETQRGNIPVLNKLLTSGTGSVVQEPFPANSASASPTPRQARSSVQTPPPSTPIVLPSKMEGFTDRREPGKDRRVSGDRRVSSRGRRASDG
jgi:curved DNA-binding protein CbpA